MPHLSFKGKRTAVVGATLALGLAGAGAAGATEIRLQHCGTMRGAWSARYSILADRAGCGTARTVFAALFARKGTRRMDPFTSQTDKVIDGWMCGKVPGGFSCIKLGPHGAVPQQLGPNISAEVI